MKRLLTRLIIWLEINGFKHEEITDCLKFILQ